MLKLIRKIFTKEKETFVEELNEKNLTGWLENKLSALEFNSYLQVYSQQITDLKKQLRQKTQILKVQEITEQDQKQVQDRVKNIVAGHKNHYVNEIERFTDNLYPTGKIYKICKTSRDYQEILSFNGNLDKELAELAKRTAKSYQAAQHLFFESVENIFRSMRELNKIVKDFEQKVNRHKIRDLQKVEDLIVGLHRNIEKRIDLEEQAAIKENELIGLGKEKDKAGIELKNLAESEKYREILKLKENKNRLEQEYKEIEYKIFSFFSKLQKALKKYERVALENKLINNYLDDYVRAFLHDSELKIISTLNGLKKSLGNLNFDEKQKNNFLQLIEKAESGYLQKLHTMIKNLQKQKSELDDRLKNDKIEKEIEKVNRNKAELDDQIERTKLEISDFKTKLEKINLEEDKKELSRNIKEVFNVELKIT